MSSKQRWSRRVWGLIGMAVMVGSVGACFLLGLELVTKWRLEHPWWLAALPVAGLLTVEMYERWGKGAEHGVEWLLEEYHGESPRPLGRMAPLIVAATWLTHLGGGSAGREGTAVQMGGGLGAWVADRLGLGGGERREMLLAGVAAGFGAVFGTPWAASFFAVEAFGDRRAAWGRWPVAVAAAWVGDLACRAWGAHHATVRVLEVRWDEAASWGWKVVLVAILAGGVGQLYFAGARLLGRWWKRWVPGARWRVVSAAVCVWLGVWGWGNRELLGLGVTPGGAGEASIPGFLEGGDFSPWAWLGKGVMTALTLAGGFRGGEVTPLFFMGAGLGWACSGWMGWEGGWAPAVGMIAIFAAVTRAPLACFCLGLELFGWRAWPVMALGCAASMWWWTGPVMYLASKRWRRDEGPKPG